MLPSEHMKYGLIAAVIAVILFPSIGATGILMIFLGSFLIDFDHYVYFVIKRKDWDLGRAVDFYLKRNKEVKQPLMFLHTVEIGILLLILSYFNMAFFYLLIGAIVHVVIDIIYLKKNKILHTRSHSSILYLLRRRHSKT